MKQKNKASVDPSHQVAGNVSDAAHVPTVCFIYAAPHDVKAADEVIWGRGLRERLEILFSREGVNLFIDESRLAECKGQVLLVRADAVIDGPLIPYLRDHQNFALLSDEESTDAIIAAHVPIDLAKSVAHAMRHNEPLPAEFNLELQRPANLNTSFWNKLRKREVPYARIVTAHSRADVEWRMFMGTYKGATDVVTKYVWPRPAFLLSRWLAPTFVTPNIVTTLSAICVLLAIWWFMEGHYVPGLVAAWMMTFLDTVDGKLARTTLTSSKWGDIFDHGIDLIHPPFWYVAWAFGLPAAGFNLDGETMSLVLTVIIGGYILQRIMEGISIALLKLEIHIWRPIDTAFRLITARRNPNLVILTLFTLIFWRPDVGLIAVAVWTFVCLVLHGIQLIHALIAKSRQGNLTSWMTKPVTNNEQ